MSELLKVSGLHAGYGRAEVLTGLDLRLRQGEVVTVIGPNGAGKSTTLNALMGVLPARGQVLFDGEDVNGLGLEERVMKGLALVPEKRELFTTMSVEDNLVLGGFRPMRLGVKDWRDELERVYALFPRLKERRVQLAGVRNGAITVNLKTYGLVDGPYHPVVRDVEVTGMSCGRSRNALKLIGLPESKIADLRVADSTFANVSGTGVARSDVTGLQLSNVRINGVLTG